MARFSLLPDAEQEPLERTSSMPTDVNHPLLTPHLSGRAETAAIRANSCFMQFQSYHVLFGVRPGMAVAKRRETEPWLMQL